MRISEPDWLEYIRRLEKIDKKAADKIRKWVDVHGLGDSDALIEYAYAVSTNYGEASAALSAEMYDAMAEASGAYVNPAELADTATYEEVAKTVNGVLKRSQNANEMAGAVSRLVKRAGADTTLKNAERDGAQFAWIPHGDTCAFCIALASQGWQYMSKNALKGNHAEHIHANCDCTYAVRFDGKTTIEGYNPDVYKKIYYGADGNTPEERINSMRRTQYAANNDGINAQKRAAYKKRTEFVSVLDKYMENATPGEGSVIKEPTRVFKNREEENMNILHKKFGGDIIVLEEIDNIDGKKSPDFFWKNHYWEEQEPKAHTKNAIDKNTREGIHQIYENPGGIVLDVGNSEMPKEMIGEVVLDRLRRSASFNCDIVLIRNGNVEEVWQYKKRA